MERRSKIWFIGWSVIAVVAVLSPALGIFYTGEISGVDFAGFLITALAVLAAAIWAYRSERVRVVLGTVLLGLLLTGFGSWATVAVWNGEISGLVVWNGVPIPLIVIGPVAVLGGVLCLLGAVGLALADLVSPRRWRRRSR
jgi:hypothetical protein